MTTPHLGVLAGLRIEADSLIRHLPADLQVTVFVTGARLEQTRNYAQRLVDGGATHLLSYGYAGGLDPAFHPGTLLLPRSVVTRQGKLYLADGEWLEKAHEVLRGLNPLAGAHVGVDEPVSDVAEKGTLYLRTRGAAGVDMESHILAEVAEQNRLPFLAVRVILDAADHDVPPAAIASVKANGATSMIRLAGSLIRRPGQIVDLNRLARAAQEAEKTLLSCGSRGGPVGFGMR